MGKSLAGLFLAAVLIGVGAGCNGGNFLSGGSGPATAQKDVCLQMTTFCENDPHTTLQYNFANNNGDGCGITFGCIGFTTGTFTGNILIQYYTTLNPANILAKYIPALNQIDAEVRASGSKSDDTTGLASFIYDVERCTDPLFKQAQVDELDKMFWEPAQTLAAGIGAKYPLTLAFIYDMCVNHGQDAAQGFINATSAALGGTPASGVPERQWLAKCIAVRLAAFISNGWGGSDRVLAFQRVYNSNNLNLAVPFTFSCYGDTCTIDGNVGDVEAGQSVRE